jgi:hypothetical protein
MVEVGGEGLEELRHRLGELSERQAAHARDLVDAIEKRRLEAREQGMNFVALSADQILQRLKGGNTPFISGVVWNNRVPAPGTLHVIVDIDNPDPVHQIFIYTHLFVGPAGLSADVEQALALVDTRFPRATQPKFFGLIMDPYSRDTVRFDLPISGRIEESHYMANLFLVRLDPFEGGEVQDRVTFVFKLRDRPEP